jgi:hypothetical protein
MLPWPIRSLTAWRSAPPASSHEARPPDPALSGSHPDQTRWAARVINRYLRVAADREVLDSAPDVSRRYLRIIADEGHADAAFALTRLLTEATDVTSGTRLGVAASLTVCSDNSYVSDGLLVGNFNFGCGYGASDREALGEVHAVAAQGGEGLLVGDEFSNGMDAQL